MVKRPLREHMSSSHGLVQRRPDPKARDRSSLEGLGRVRQVEGLEHVPVTATILVLPPERPKR